MNTTLLASAALGAAVFAAAPIARAVVISDDFGTYTASPTDVSGLGVTAGFGTIGAGWLNGWRSSSSNVTTTAKVLDASPLVAGGGNYFSATINTGSSAALGAGAVGRSYDFTSNYSLASASFGTSFDFRVDSATDATKLRYDIFENGIRASGGSGAGTSWQLIAKNGFWYVRDANTEVATSMAFATGVTYSFVVGVDFATRKWSVNISDGGTSVSLSAINTRTPAGTAFVTDTNDGSIGGRWVLAAATETTDLAGNTTTFSLDNLYVGDLGSIPEPASAAALAGLALLGFATTRRRARR